MERAERRGDQTADPRGARKSSSDLHSTSESCPVFGWVVIEVKADEDDVDRGQRWIAPGVQASVTRCAVRQTDSANGRLARRYRPAELVDSLCGRGRRRATMGTDGCRPRTELRSVLIYPADGERPSTRTLRLQRSSG